MGQNGDGADWRWGGLAMERNADGADWRWGRLSLELSGVGARRRVGEKWQEGLPATVR